LIGHRVRKSSPGLLQHRYQIHHAPGAAAIDRQIPRDRVESPGNVLDAVTPVERTIQPKEDFLRQLLGVGAATAVTAGTERSARDNW
jgi:hypothetical protein